MEFRLANTEDLPRILELIEQARRFLKSNGVNQWQGDYPQMSDLEADIAQKACYVAEEAGEMMGVVTVIFGDEAGYEQIKGAWKSEQPYAVVHRMAVDDAHKGKGVSAFLMQNVDALCAANGVHSIKTDTDPMNLPMNHVLRKSGYAFCGTVWFENSEKVAYEKLL